MNDLAKIKYYPKNSLKAFDGMSVTADVWEMAHDEHREMMRAHMLSMHHPGIICGLEIRANDPADHYVFISPGAAVDSMGRVIVIDQTIAYDFGDEGEGTYLLLLGYAEHEKEVLETKIKLMQHEYIIAARQSLPKQPVVELGRVTFSAKGAAIRDAKDPYQPEKDELDLRYRLESSKGTDQIRVFAATFPFRNEAVYQGWRAMMIEMQRMLPVKLIVDMYPEINERVNDYDIVYIGASGTFDATETQRALLKNYYNNGKGIIIESLDAGGNAALKSIAELFKAGPVDPVKCGFYEEPFFFRVPPEQISEKRLFCAEKLIISMDPLAVAWGGELNGELLSRAEIRTNLEWGANLVTYCAK